MSPATYQEAPAEARGAEGTDVVYWGYPQEDADPFLSGALWYAYLALTFLTSGWLSDLASEAQLLERYNPTVNRWELLA